MKNTKSTWSKNAIRLEDCWDTFVIEHPELGFTFNKYGQVTNIQFPLETDHILFILNMNQDLSNNVMYLSYTYLGNLIHYEDDLLKDL